MKKRKKIFLIFGTIFATICFVAVFLPFFIDLNQFKPKIQEFVFEKTKTKIDFDSARLNLMGGLGITFKNISFTNKHRLHREKEKFLSVKDFEIQFKIIPLFSKRFEGVVYLYKPSINIIQIDNKNNFYNLFKLSKKDGNDIKTNSSKNHSYTLILNEFYVENADILFEDFTDKSSPTILDFKDIYLTIMHHDQILDVTKFNLNIFSGQLNAQMKINLSDPKISYNGEYSLKKISFADIYKSFNTQTKKSPINGVGNIDFTFEGAGTTKPVYSKSLNGKGNFKIKTGEFLIDTTLPIILDQLGSFLTTILIPGFNLGISKDDVKNIEDTQNTKISLQNMQGDFEVKNGVLFLKNDIPMVQGLLKLDTTIGVFSGKLKGTAVFIANEPFKKELIAKNKNFSYLLDKNDDFYLKIFLAGTIANPEITVDTSDVMANVVRRSAKSILNPIETVPNIIEKTLKTIFNPF